MEINVSYTYIFSNQKRYYCTVNAFWLTASYNTTLCLLGSTTASWKKEYMLLQLYLLFLINELSIR